MIYGDRIRQVREYMGWTQHDLAAPRHRQRGEAEAERMRAEEPDRVNGPERPPEAHERPGPCACSFERASRARVERERDVAHRGRNRVAPPVSRSFVQPAEEQEPVDVLGQPVEEEHERALAEHLRALPTVEVVGVDG